MQVQSYPKFDAYCTKCLVRYLYMLLTNDYFTLADWVKKTNRLAAHCPKCQTDSCILFGEVLAP